MNLNFKIMFAMVAMMLKVNKNDIAIITVKHFDYICVIHNISNFEAINLLKNSVPEDRGYI